MTKPDEKDLAVIAERMPPMARKVILIDFDDTIAPFGHRFNYPKPFKGAAEFTQALKFNGYTIGIFTSRLDKAWLSSVGDTEEAHINYITDYCHKNQIRFDFITANKTPAQAYIDDKAIRFEGNWDDITYQFVTKGWL